jgi:hypothetical protein
MMTAMLLCLLKVMIARVLVLLHVMTPMFLCLLHMMFDMFLSPLKVMIVTFLDLRHLTIATFLCLLHLMITFLLCLLHMMIVMLLSLLKVIIAFHPDLALLPFRHHHQTHSANRWSKKLLNSSRQSALLTHRSDFMPLHLTRVMIAGTDPSAIFVRLECSSPVVRFGLILIENKFMLTLHPKIGEFFFSASAWPAF